MDNKRSKKFGQVPLVRRGGDEKPSLLPPDRLHPVNDPLQKYGPVPPESTPAAEVPVVQKTSMNPPAEQPVAAQAPTAPTAPTVVRDPYQGRIQQAEQEIERLSTPTDKSEDSRLRSGLEGAMRGLAEYFNPQFGIVRNWDEFFARLAGAGGSGVGGAINDKWDEEDQRLRKLDEQKRRLGELQAGQKNQQDTLFRNKQMENLERDDQRAVEQFAVREQNKVLMEQRRFDNRIKQMNRQAEIDGNKWKTDIDEQGRVWKLFADGRREPMPDPDDPSKQDISPEHRLYETYSPLTGTMIQVKGGQLLTSETQLRASQVSAENRTADNEYQDGVRAAELRGKIAGATARIAEIDRQLATLTNVDPQEETQEEFARKEKLTAERRAAAAEKAQYEGTLKNLPKRQAVQGPKTTTKAMVEAYAKKKGISYEQAAAAAAAEGFTIK